MTSDEDQAPATWLARQAAERRHSPALIGPGGERSFLELFEHARALCTAFVRGGLQPGEAIAALRPEADLVYAAALLGCPLMLLDPEWPEGVRSEILRKGGPARLFEGALPAPESPTLCAGARRAEDVQAIVATSGSTGGPKGVMLSARGIAAAVRAQRSRIPLGPGDAWLGCLPLFHVGGLMILYRCLEAGAAVVLHQGFEVDAVGRELAGGRITHLSLVPAMLARLLDAGVRPPSGLRCVLVGGAALSVDLAGRARAAGWPVAVSYGLSEAASQVATLFPLPADWHPGLVGEPLEGFEVDISSAGHIRIRGAAVMAGYANPARRPGEGLVDGWFETADLGRFDGAGRLVFLGRADAALCSGGETFQPEAVEALIARCPGVREAAIGTRDDPVWGERLVAVAAGEVTAEALVAWCRLNLAGNRRPREARIVKALPRTALGKLDRVRLRQWVRE